MKTSIFTISFDDLGTADTTALLMPAGSSRKEAAEEFTRRTGKKVLLCDQVQPRVGEDNLLGINEEFDIVCSRLTAGELQVLEKVLSMVAQRGSHYGGRNKERELRESKEV